MVYYPIYGHLDGLGFTCSLCNKKCLHPQCVDYSTNIEIL